MAEANKLDATAEPGKDRPLFDPFAILTERQQIHLVIARERAQQMERALVGASIHRERNVRIDNEDAHS